MVSYKKYILSTYLAKPCYFVLTRTPTLQTKSLEGQKEVMRRPGRYLRVHDAIYLPLLNQPADKKF
jgi:hypothetical protein